MTATPITVTLERTLQRSEDVLFQEVGGEAVLLDMASEQYFGLDPVGTRIWELIDGQRTLAQIHGVLCDEYDVEPERIGDDLLALAESLLQAGLAKPGG